MLNQCRHLCQKGRPVRKTEHKKNLFLDHNGMVFPGEHKGQVYILDGLFDFVKNLDPYAFPKPINFYAPIAFQIIVPVGHLPAVPCA